MLAALLGRGTAVRTLLAAGADANIKDAEGHTALYVAMYEMADEVALELLRGGADPAARVQGYSPLWWADKLGMERTAQALDAMGAPQ
jgi:ankyrin repeat protein